MAVLRIAFEEWTSGPEGQDLHQLLRDSLAELKSRHRLRLRRKVPGVYRERVWSMRQEVGMGSMWKRCGRAAQPGRAGGDGGARGSGGVDDDAAARRARRTLPPQRRLPDDGFCAAVGTQNLIATSTEPTGGAGAWHTIYAGEGRYEKPSWRPGDLEPPGAGRLLPLVRASASRSPTLGQIYTSTDPTGPASAWSVAELKPTGDNIHLYGVSCPTESLCVAVSGRRVNKGKVFTSTDPTGGVAAWQEADLGEGFDLRAVSCSSATLCVAAGANGELIASTDPTGGPGAWSLVGAPGGEHPAVDRLRHRRLPHRQHRRQPARRERTDQPGELAGDERRQLGPDDRQRLRLGERLPGGRQQRRRDRLHRTDRRPAGTGR